MQTLAATTSRFWVRSSVAMLAASMALGLFACATMDPTDALFMNTPTRATVFVSGKGQAIRKIALLPFKAPTELIGASVSDLCITEMMRARRYELVERGQLTSVLGEAELALAGLSDAKAAKVGKMAGAQGVIIGTVAEYGTVAQRGKTYPVVALTLRLIDCETGSIVWSADLSERAASSEITSSEQAKIVVHQLVAALYKEWRHSGWHPSRGMAASRSPNRVVPRTGAAAGGPARATGTAPSPGMAPATPGDFEVTQGGLREVILRWRPPADRPAKYVIERSLWSDGGFQPIAEAHPGTGEYRDKGEANRPLQDDTAYFYRLVAVAADGTRSVPGPVMKSVTAPPPSPPARLMAETPALRTIALSWPASTAPDVTRYAIERAAGEGDEAFERVAETAQTSWTDGGPVGSTLADGTRYRYRVSAVNKLGARGPPGTPVAVTARPPPGTVHGLSAVGGLRCVHLHWQPRPEAESIVRYDLFRTEAGGQAERIASLEDAAAHEYLDGGGDPGRLPDGRSYRYHLVAVSAAGVTGPPCPPVEAATRGAPPVVEGLQALPAGARTVALSWRPSPDDAVTHYVVVRHDELAGEFREIARVEGRENTQYTDHGAGDAEGKTASLLDGAVYNYSIAAVNAVQVRSAWAKPVSVRTKPVPGVPTGVTASTNEARRIRITWTANPEPDIAHYVIEGAGAPDGPFLAVNGEVREISVVDPVSPPGRVRYYRVQAVDREGLAGAFSPPVAGRAKPLPDPPSGLKAEYRSGSVLLSWRAPPQPDVTSYRVTFQGAGGRQEVLTTTDAQCPLTWPQVPRTTIVVVTAVDRDGLESRPSDHFEIGEPAPPVPAGVAASSGGLRDVTLRWTPAKDNATAYHVERAASPEGPFELVNAADPRTGQFIDRGPSGGRLEDSTTYYYRLVAVSAGGRHSEPSATAAGGTAPPPDPPKAVRASAHAARGAHLEWKAPDSEGIARYLVERASADAADRFTRVGEVAGTAFEEGGTADSPLADDTEYCYRVVAVNRVGGSSAPSEVVRIRTRPPPAAVAGLVAQAGEVRCVPLRWNPSTEEDVVQYVVQRAPEEQAPFRPIASVKGRASTDYLDGETNPGKLGDEQSFCYRVLAVNAVGAESAPCPVVRATTRPVPPVVEGVRAESGRARAVPVSWTVSPDEKVTGYVLERASEKDPAFHEVATIDGRENATWVDRGGARPREAGRLADGARYFYRVAAFNAARARSAWSTPAEAAVKPLPAAPAGLAASSDQPKAIRVAWSANAEADIATYVVETSPKGGRGFTQLARIPPTADPLQTVHARRADGEERVYRVRAVDADGLESPWSAAAAGRAKPLPDAPSRLRVHREGDGHVLAWQPPPQPDCKGYRVWAKTFFSWKEIAQADEPLCRLAKETVGGGLTVAVSATDADGLESARSKPIEIKRAP